MVRGRAKRSYLLFAWQHLHVFVWTPRHGSGSAGTTVRWRKGRDWTHARATFLQRNRGRPGQHGRELQRRLGQRVRTRATLTLFEFSVWKTKDGTSERLGTKGYVRLKVAWPGRAV